MGAWRASTPQQIKAQTMTLRFLATSRRMQSAHGRGVTIACHKDRSALTTAGHSRVRGDGDGDGGAAVYTNRLDTHQHTCSRTVSSSSGSSSAATESPARACKGILKVDHGVL
jgi:hypothetical protein